MKKNVHPDWKVTKITCNCGAVYNIGTTLKEDFSTDICGKCHPAFKDSLDEMVIDRDNRIEQFKARMAKSEELKAARTKKKANQKAKPVKK